MRGIVAVSIFLVLSGCSLPSELDRRDTVTTELDIQGRVTSQGYYVGVVFHAGEVIPGARVMLEKSGKVYDSTLTDESGTFSFSTEVQHEVVACDYRLVASATGYRTHPGLVIRCMDQTQFMALRLYPQGGSE